MRFFSTFIFLIMALGTSMPYAVSQEMMLGRIADQGGEIFTSSQIIQAALFSSLAIFLTVKKGYQNIVLKNTILFLSTLAGLCLVAPTATPLLSLPSFSEFKLPAIILTLISLIALSELARTHILKEEQGQNVLIKRICYGSYISLTIITFMLSFVANDIVTSLLQTLWIGTIITCVVGGFIKSIRERFETDIFLYCTAPILTGLLLAFGVHGNDQIIPAAVRFIGFLGAFIAAAAMTYKLNMIYNNKINSSQVKKEKSDPIKQNNIATEEIESDLTLTLNIASHSVTISDALAILIGLESAKREYDLDHFKALIHQEFHNNFTDSLYENSLHKDTPIMFHGVEKTYLLQQMTTENLNKCTFNLIPAELLQQDMSLLTSIQSVHAQSLFDTFFIAMKETIFASPSYLEGHFCLALVDISNLEMLFLEGTHQERRKVPEILISRLTKKIMHFEHLRIMQTTSTELGIFFYSTNARHDFQVAQNMIQNICELPIECSFGNFFAKAVIATSQLSADQLKQGLKNDDLLNHMVETAQKSLLSKSLSYGDILPDNIALPTGTTTLGLSSELRYAPEKNQIEPYFSPYISLETGNIAGFYTRAFWLHPDHGLIDNELLAYLSQDIGYDGVIQRMHMIMALECFSKIIQKNPEKGFFLRIPIGKVALCGKFDIISEIATLIKKFQIPAAQIHICLKDDCITKHSDWLLPILKELKTVGTTIVFNNYGGNATKINHLTELPVDYIILNEMLIKNLHQDERKQYAVKTLLNLFKNLNIQADIHHLDSLDPIATLKKFGIKNIMGSVCGKEMSYGNISAFISQKSKNNHLA